MNMKIKPVYIVIIVLVLLSGGVWYYSWYQKSNWRICEDRINNVQFSCPRAWSFESTPNLISLIPDPTRPQDLNILIKVDPDQFFVDILNLGDDAQTLQIGDKTVRIAQREETIPADISTPTSTLPYTWLYWKDSSGKGYIFEISPWPSPDLSSDLQRILSTFKPLSG